MTLSYKHILSKSLRSIHTHLFIAAATSSLVLALFTYAAFASFPQKAQAQTEESYWLLLHRKSEIEYLYYGTPGNIEKSTHINTFQVNTGISGQKPTPLPQLLGREYWIIVKKDQSHDNPETAPFFLELDVPVSDFPPYGPTPYIECLGSYSAGIDGQCNWELPGYFGLHGIAGDPSRLTDEGSSGCIRHSDEDITYLYNLLDPKTEEIRYYIEDK